MTTLDIAAFRAMFPAYADEIKYPDILLNAQYEIGKCYITDSDCVLEGDCLGYALMAMLAHLLYLRDQVASGNNGKQVASATEGPVSVSFTEPPTTDMFTYWLSSSPYGIDLLALLSVNSVGGFYIGGSNGFQAYRKDDGGF